MVQAVHMSRTTHNTDLEDTAAGEGLAGVIVRPLDRHVDERGDLVELFRRSWDGVVDPVQWNLVRTKPGTLRGVHVHSRHSDYLIPAIGRFWLALKDIRPASPTHGRVLELDLHGDDACTVTIPPGVAHGFYFPDGGAFIYGVTDYWSLDDELGCAWDDPGLGFRWPLTGPPVVSERDRTAGSLDVMTRAWSEQVLASSPAAG